MDPARMEAVRARMDQLFPQVILRESFEESEQPVKQSQKGITNESAETIADKSPRTEDDKSPENECIESYSAAESFKSNSSQSTCESISEPKFDEFKASIESKANLGEVFKEVFQKLSKANKKSINKIKNKPKKSGAKLKMKFIDNTLDKSSVGQVSSNPSDNSDGTAKFKNVKESGGKSPKKRKLSKVKLSEITSSRPQLSICPVKKKKYKKSKDLNGGEDLAEKPDKPFGCIKCDFRSNYKGSLKEHMAAKHSKKRPFACSFCSYKASRKPDLTKHILIVHDGYKPYNCGYCEYKTSHSAALKRHINALHTHHEIHSCPHCTFQAARKYNLTNHIALKHPDKAEGVKFFYCGDCNYTSINKNHLKNHILSKHMGEKPFICPYMNCNVSTSGKSTLTRHIAEIHSGIKRHKCTDCNYSSHRLSRVKEHYANKHSNGSKTFSCVFCSYSTNKSSNLEIHVVKKHQNVERQTQIDLTGLNLIVSTSMASQNMNVKIDQSSLALNVSNLWGMETPSLNKGVGSSISQTSLRENLYAWNNQNLPDSVDSVNDQNCQQSIGQTSSAIGMNSQHHDSQTSINTHSASESIKQNLSIGPQSSHDSHKASPSTSSSHDSFKTPSESRGQSVASPEFGPNSPSVPYNLSNVPPNSPYSARAQGGSDQSRQSSCNQFSNQNPTSPNVARSSTQVRNNSVPPDHNTSAHDFYDPVLAKNYPTNRIQNSSAEMNPDSPQTSNNIQNSSRTHSQNTFDSVPTKGHRNIQNFPTISDHNSAGYSQQFSKVSTHESSQVSLNSPSPIPPNSNLPIHSQNSFSPTPHNFSSDIGSRNSYQFIDKRSTSNVPPHPLQTGIQNSRSYQSGSNSINVYKDQSQLWGVQPNPPNDWGLNYPP